ncbi:MAG: DnaJ domain-containing protein [Rhodospirillales bacterium]|nr:DnaJ domain-containing protein [Rhodospirillales bacterium]
MFPYLVLGLAIFAGILLAGRWFTTADPKLLVKVLKWGLLGVIGSVALFFLFTGRLAWAIFALPALLPWLMRARAAHRMFKIFSRMTSGWGGGPTGQSSDIETRFLRMVLDHDSGRMSGEVIDGDFTGRTLAGMSLDDLVDLLQTCLLKDEPSAQVLETYLDREHPDWRECVHAETTGNAEGAGGRGSRRGNGSMPREEAFEILGLQEGASETEIREAHRRLIAAIHPDHGGSTYLAAQINQAKDVLITK